MSYNVYEVKSESAPEVPPVPTPVGEPHRPRRRVASRSPAPAKAKADQVQEEVVVGSTDKTGSSQECVVLADGSTKLTHKIVEASVVKIPEWEGVGKTRMWISQLIDACVVAGGGWTGSNRIGSWRSTMV